MTFEQLEGRRNYLCETLERECSLRKGQQVQKLCSRNDHDVFQEEKEGNVAVGKLELGERMEGST